MDSIQEQVKSLAAGRRKRGLDSQSRVCHVAEVEECRFCPFAGTLLLRLIGKLILISMHPLTKIHSDQQFF